MRIFMSYRRADSADVSGRIYDRLVEHFGDEAIFKDVDDIPYGVNFRVFLNDMVSESAIELVIIGPTWLDSQDDEGRRLDDPSDWVRIEIEAALQRGIPVIPVLVRGASMPPVDRLPDDLKELSDRHGTRVRPDPDFHRDMDRLIAGIETHLQAAETSTIEPPAQEPVAPEVSSTAPGQAPAELRPQQQVVRPARGTKRKTRRWLWPAIGLLVVVGMIAVTLLVSRGPSVGSSTNMPDLRGLPFVDAEARVTDAGLTLTIGQIPEGCPAEASFVVDQAPEPQTELPPGDQVMVALEC